jgi:hypothetical protein
MPNIYALAFIISEKYSLKMKLGFKRYARLNTNAG